MEDATAGASHDLPTVNPPAFYAPLLWPFLYVYEGIRSPDKLRVAKPISMSHLGLSDNILSFVASLRSFLMAYAVVYWLHDEENPYPAWGKGSSHHQKTTLLQNRSTPYNMYVHICRRDAALKLDRAHPHKKCAILLGHMRILGLVSVPLSVAEETGEVQGDTDYVHVHQPKQLDSITDEPRLSLNDPIAPRRPALYHRLCLRHGC